MPSATVLDLCETQLSGADQNQRKDDTCRLARKPNSNATTVLWTLCARSPSAGQASRETGQTRPTIRTRPRMRTKISNYNITGRANKINIKLLSSPQTKPANSMPRIGRVVLTLSILEIGLERQVPPTAPSNCNKFTLQKSRNAWEILPTTRQINKDNIVSRWSIASNSSSRSRRKTSEIRSKKRKIRGTKLS